MWRTLFVILLAVFIVYVIYDEHQEKKELEKQYSLLMNDYAYVKKMLYYTNLTKRNLTEELIKKDEELKECNNEKSRLESRIFELSSNSVQLKTDLATIKKILKEDDTDEMPYVEGEFVCTEFTNSLIKAFINNGIFACETTMTFNDEEFGHSIVAVMTEDKGLIYIEPQDDIIIYDEELEPGDDYCDVVGWYCNWEVDKISNCFELEIKNTKFKDYM